MRSPWTPRSEVVDTPRRSPPHRPPSSPGADLWTAPQAVDGQPWSGEEVAMILVVGATGQLGSLVVRALRDRGRPVRALVRDPAAAQDLAATGAELAEADLTGPATLDAALEGVSAIVATANVVAPTRTGDTAAALDTGYAELITRGQRA